MKSNLNYANGCEYKMTCEEIRFQCRKVQYKNVVFTVWNVGGQEKLRPLWRHYFNNTDGLFYVVDSLDRERIGKVREEFQAIMKDPFMLNSIILVFANKQDKESTVVVSVVRRLSLNFITRPRILYGGATYPVYSDGNQPGVLQRVGSAAANFVLLKCYTFNYLVSSSADGSRSPLADISLLVLLVLIHYRKCVKEDESPADNNIIYADVHSYSKESTYFCENPYCKALENARDIEFDRVDIEGNAQNGPVVRLPFASLFDTLGLQ